MPETFFVALHFSLLFFTLMVPFTGFLSFPKGLNFGQELVLSVATNEMVNDDLAVCSPTALGFSLNEKIWNEIHTREFAVEDVEDIKFSMPHLTTVGKTLTAEAITEQLERPLYSISSVDLSARAEEMEVQLTRIFCIASDWKAVLLLDEADVYLQQRDDVGFTKMDQLDGKVLRIIIKNWKIYTGALIYFTITALDIQLHSSFSPFSISLDIQHPSLRFKVSQFGPRQPGVTILVGYLTQRLSPPSLGFCHVRMPVRQHRRQYFTVSTHGSSTVKHLAIFIVTIGVFIAQPVTVAWISNNWAGHYKHAVGSAVQNS
ncbi:hypothetical protein PAAG_07215 [Paracoccidioides lutzii Pb01]|uniref:ATPase AAA-type core domain-containing protein n=1 Tax=Paracoccidioides lutzii (strain ATCC MYA-826 / Pb01) TaxID=502779 RepID=C1H8X4_PARBA|nr:hypothetical protein PAAG_07215 [Paracoccidioides lutzii Pb01]EEH36797.2 hypothetical protein PAAG_07215 [Paracoccidioides lutzii Pb01]